MHRRARSILRGEQGLSMILVLCIGALFVALAAALVYAASLMMANADRQLPEQDVYELAVSFSDVLEQELLHYRSPVAVSGAAGFMICFKHLVICADREDIKILPYLLSFGSSAGGNGLVFIGNSS